MTRLNVYVHTKRLPNGKERINCMCLSENKICDKECELSKVLYDKYEGWEDCYKVNRYGK